MTTKEYNESVDKYADGIFRFILQRLKNEDVARDVVQDTFAKVWLKKESVAAEKAKSYLFTTAHHTMIDLLRKEKYQKEIESIDQSSLHEGRYQKPDQNFDLQAVLHNALNQLPDIQKSVILLRDYEGYAYDEIGEITNLTESQVKVYIFRARKKLKSILGSLELIID